MVGEALARRGSVGLQGRDVDYVQWRIPLLWPLLQLWFRPQIRGLDRIPADGPVLLVGNHSGGNVAPDTLVFTAAFVRRFGAARPFFQLAHQLVVAAPWLGLLRRYGTVTASPGNARAALDSGAAVLVYPGGDWEAHRPVCRATGPTSTAGTASSGSPSRPARRWCRSCRSAARRPRCS
jgi:1-acyl-sn-glycerol-3-phosphate acyltransferase